MTTLLSRPAPKNNGTYTRYLLALCLTVAGLILVAASMMGSTDHRPFISWLPDQRIASGAFLKKFFIIKDIENDQLLISWTSSDTTHFLDPVYIMVQPCNGADQTQGCASATDGGYKVFFNAQQPTSDGVTTVTITATEKFNSTRSTSVSFTLRRDSTGSYPPSVGAMPNQVIPLPSQNGSATYNTMFVVGDLKEDGIHEDYADTSGNSLLSFSPPPSSSNPNVLTSNAIQPSLVQMDVPFIGLAGPRSFLLTATSVNGTPSPTGSATVTVNLTDPDSNTTSTPFVFTVVPTTDTPPVISNTTKTFEEQDVQTMTSGTHSYTVASSDTPLNEITVTANSSNTTLIPNASISVGPPDSITGQGTVTVTPVLPLPPPGVPCAATITLSAADATSVGQTTFLYVVKDSSSPALMFSRPTGIYSLDPTPTEHRLLDFFLTGEMHGVQWANIETGIDDFHWDTFEGVVAGLPTNQDLSLNLQQEPCYIDNSTTPPLQFLPWCDTDTSRDPGCGTTSCVSGSKTGYLRAEPWDPYLQARDDNFLDKLKTELISLNLLNRVSVINTNLPGGFTGIRNVSQPFDPALMQGYSRGALLQAIQHELRTVQDLFPGKLVQIGFFLATDGQDSMYGYKSLSSWLYRDASGSLDPFTGVHYISLFDEFNGIRRPRVSFFQEDLAAARTLTPSGVDSSNAPNYVTPSATTPYVMYPPTSNFPSFAYYTAPSIDSYKNGMTFQSNTPWSNPFASSGGVKLLHTINGSPNDGMEAAYNSLLSEYLEIYPPDIDHAVPQGTDPLTVDAVLWKGELQSWKDYTDSLRALAPLEAPAQLSVTRNADNTNTISWAAVYAPYDAANPVHYSVNRKMGSNWIPVSCASSTDTMCIDTSSTGSAYQYQVRATKGAHSTPFSYVAGFLSESGYDGYVSSSTASPNDSQPGIRAGEDNTGSDLHGILSFNTSSLVGTTVLTAKLRLKETNSDSTASSALGACFVDIEKGSFSGNMTLQTTDFGSSDSGTGTKVSQLLPPAAPPDWSEAYLDSTGISLINNVMMGRTQFRIYFNHAALTNKYVGWNSGEFTTSGTSAPPQLIVQYQ